MKPKRSAKLGRSEIDRKHLQTKLLARTRTKERARREEGLQVPVNETSDIRKGKSTVLDQRVAQDGEQKKRYRKVYDLIREGNFESAARWIIQNEIESESSDAEKNHAWYVLGTIRFHQEDYERSLRSFLWAIRYNTDDPEAWTAIGNCYDSLLEYENAYASFKIALQFRRDDPDILFNMAGSLMDMERYKEACSILKSLKPDERILHNIEICEGQIPSSKTP